MKIKLVFSQTRYDQSNMWTEYKTVEVDVPEWVGEKWGVFEWHLTGMLEVEDENS